MPVVDQLKELRGHQLAGVPLVGRRRLRERARRRLALRRVLGGRLSASLQIHFDGDVAGIA
jgi:hypothetical protein